ncbi:MAG TPA: peptide chain release factor N(5)-glutamine methyltransferase [Dongiaceae bacterium]|nr:peptide chain release factor N(5)-glutamine methyltransferase [Dongiaceae bacterium]
MTRVGAALREAGQRLAAAGVEDAPRDARLLLQAASGLSMATLVAFPERDLEAGVLARFHELLARRERREPMAQILGVREFWSLRFRVTADTLDPRPDSETLVQAVLDHVPDRAASLRLVDFGTGTGCLLLALLHELPNATGLGIDRSEPALAVAAQNSRNLGLDARATFRQANWDDGVAPFFDIVISNPPYIERDAIAGLQPEVARFEPHLALDGGADGLDAYRKLLPAAARLLRPGGLAAFEVGAGQADSVAAIGTAARLRHIATVRDLGHVPRIILWQKR